MLRSVEVAREKESIENAGRHVGLIALQTVQEHSSQLSFERWLATCTALGVDIGTKNHSKEFVAGFRHAAHECLTESIQSLLRTEDPATGRPPAFATIADKATVRKKTGQMHGLILMIEGELQSIFLSTLEVCPALPLSTAV